MSTLHPHWHSTDEEDRVPVHSAQEKEGVQKPVGVRSVSRKPAAVVGIALVTVVGLAFFGGLRSLTGQLSANTVTVHITENGMQPATVTVAQGQSVEWTNDQTVPHMIESQDLCNAEGECLFTPTVFPGDHVVFDITQDIAPGIYTFGSVIAPDLIGQIIVTVGEQVVSPPPAEAPPPPAEEETTLDDIAQNLSASATDTLPPSTQLERGTPPQNTPPQQLAATSDLSANVLAPQNIPTNTNTVGSQQFTAPAATHTGAPPSGHKPFRQPETGVGTWILCCIFLLSLSTLLWREHRASL